MEVEVKGNQLVITVPLTPEKEAPYSYSGKNKVLYSSGGFTPVNGHRINLTVIPAKSWRNWTNRPSPSRDRLLALNELA